MEGVWDGAARACCYASMPGATAARHLCDCLFCSPQTGQSVSRELDARMLLDWLLDDYSDEASADERAGALAALAGQLDLPQDGAQLVRVLYEQDPVTSIRQLRDIALAAQRAGLLSEGGER